MCSVFNLRRRERESCSQHSSRHTSNSVRTAAITSSGSDSLNSSRYSRCPRRCSKWKVRYSICIYFFLLSSTATLRRRQYIYCVRAKFNSRSSSSASFSRRRRPSLGKIEGACVCVIPCVNLLQLVYRQPVAMRRNHPHRRIWPTVAVAVEVP